jgi:hypothetical protein
LVQNVDSEISVTCTHPGYDRRVCMWF